MACRSEILLCCTHRRHGVSAAVQRDAMQSRGHSILRTLDRNLTGGAEAFVRPAEMMNLGWSEAHGTRSLRDATTLRDGHKDRFTALFRGLDAWFRGRS